MAATREGRALWLTRGGPTVCTWCEALYVLRGGRSAKPAHPPLTAGLRAPSTVGLRRRRAHSVDFGAVAQSATQL